MAAYVLMLTRFDDLGAPIVTAVLPELNEMRLVDAGQVIIECLDKFAPNWRQEMI